MMLVLPDASRMGYRLRLTNYFLTTMTRRTRCVTVAVGGNGAGGAAVDSSCT